jgi:hypothetical protein
MLRALLCFGLLFSWNAAHATVTTCVVPLNEALSAPAIDIIQNGASVDRDVLSDQIRHGLDSSTLEPQLSDIYRGAEQPLVQYANIPYPAEGDTVNFSNQLAGVSMLVRARVTLESDSNIAYQLNFSLDQHAALVRNALFRKLGYSIPSPKYYSKLKVRFATLEARNSFLESVGGDTITARARWVVGGQAEADGTDLVVNFQDIVLEPAIIVAPQLHWGILTTDTIASRRSIRALLVPLTLFSFQNDSVNQYSFEPARIYNENISFARENADKFKNETTIGDVKWITQKIAKLSRTDWTAIIQAGHYPADIQALLVERTLGRVDQLMKLLQIRNFQQIPYDQYITSGAVINGKATQETYPGYALRFAYGNPENPLRASEIARFFGIELLDNGLGYLLEKANTYFQVLTPQRYITEHGSKFIQELTDHFTNHPNEPFVQPLSVFGGPTLGAKLDASRSIVTGTYYGSSSQVQLVDSVSASVKAGGFFGVSGLRTVGLSFGPSAQYSRSYIHVRPLTSIKSAWEDNWKNVMVPYFMANLAKVLTGGTGVESADAIKNFLAKMNTGESFIVTDGISTGLQADVKIPLGALMGLISPYSNITADVSLGAQYAILSRITLYKVADGVHVYVSRIKNGAFTAEIEADFFIKVINVAASFSHGTAHTAAYVFPETFANVQDSKNFQNSLVQILRHNNPNEMEVDFKPFELDHVNNGSRTRLSIGPWVWSKRENMHQLEITPPVDPRYDASAFKRTVFSGTTTKINGTDLFGFFGTLLNKILPYINLGGGQQGDDPSSNFLGRSHTFGVSTEIETTPNRDNNPFTKLQQSFTGWSLTKNRLLRVLGRISDQMGEYNPSGGLIDPSEFSQTKKIEAFTVMWNLLVYQKGSANVFNILNMTKTSTQDAQAFLIKIMGEQQYAQYCQQNALTPSVQAGPFDNQDDQGTRVESANGQTTYLGCVSPMMDSVYDLRASLSSHPEVFADVRTDDDAKSKIKWTNRVYVELNNNLELGQLIKWVGKENSFFQVKLSGFRTQDEGADFRSAYYSNTVGLIDQNVLGGPTSDIESTTEISSHEVEARYLSDGY